MFSWSPLLLSGWPGLGSHLGHLDCNSCPEPRAEVGLLALHVLPSVLQLLFKKRFCCASGSFCFEKLPGPQRANDDLVPRSESWHLVGNAFRLASDPRSPGLLLRPILFLASLSLFAAAYASCVNITPAVLAAPVSLESLGCDEVAFLFFELAVGMYFPCTSALKSTKCISEHKRGLIYSLYRVPLNAFALGVLLGVSWPCEAGASL